jgi:CRISPR-associated protein Csm3
MSNVPNIAFKEKVFVSGVITALAGLHIGGNSTDMSIGGADKIVIRDPITNRPYIPGSSLRGKMRSLLERHRGEMTISLEKDRVKTVVHHVDQLSQPLSDGASIRSAGPARSSTSKAAALFGVAIDAQSEETPMPQRLVVRDAFLSLEGLKRLESARNTDMPLTEVKTEVAIDRITSKANPRQIERVPAGAEFDFEFILNLYGEDDQEVYLKLLWECMELLQDDYLGGHGSRGYGKVKFSVKHVTVKTLERYRNSEPPKAVDADIPESLQRGQYHAGLQT